MDALRKWGPCIVCVGLGDEADKQIHALGLCEKHYKAHQRRRASQSDGDGDGFITDRHVSKEIKAHQFLAERFQKFLHILNHESVTLLLPTEQIQEIRLLLNPLMVRSQRIAVPRSLPPDMLAIPPDGDMSPDDPQGTVPSAPLGALVQAREAHRRELAETVVHQREQRALAFEIVDAGYNELSRERYREGEKFRRLALATSFLRSLLGQRETESEP